MKALETYLTLQNATNIGVNIFEIVIESPDNEIYDNKDGLNFQIAGLTKTLKEI